MIVLQNSSDTIEIFLAGAVATTELPFYASWIDSSSEGDKKGESVAITSGVTVVTAIPSPKTSATSRTIQYISIHNSDTASATITVRINTQSYQRILCKCILAVGDILQYNDGAGFTVMNSSGEAKVTIGGAGMTNLSISNKTSTTFDINSSTGTDITVPQATTTEAGLLNAADKVKVNAMPLLIFAQTANKTVADTASETSIIGTGSGEMNLAANYFTTGKTIKIKVAGIYSLPGAGAPTILVKIKLGSTVIASVTTTALALSASALRFEALATITCRTTGATGTVMTDGGIEYKVNGATQPLFDSLNNGGATTTIDTTTSKLVDVTVTWDSASADRTITSTVAILESAN